MRLNVDGTQMFSQTLTQRENNGQIRHLMADFSTMAMDWTTATFAFHMSGTDDGIGISNASLNVIPLPAAALLLLGGLSAFGRRRATA